MVSLNAPPESESTTLAEFSAAPNLLDEGFPHDLSCEGMDRLSRVLTGWIATCLVGGAVLVIGNQSQNGSLVAIGWFLVVLGLFGLGAEGLQLSWRHLHPPVTPPSQPERFVDEAVLASQLAQWPGNVVDPDWVIGQVTPTFTNPQLIPRASAGRALQEARARAAAPVLPASGYLHPGAATDSGHFDRVRRVLEPLLEVLPTHEEYLAGIARIPFDARLNAVRSGYYRHVTEADDFWAYDYLQLLVELGETPALLDILRDRLVTIWKSEGGHADLTPIGPGGKAFDAAAKLARRVLRDGYDVWFDENVKSALNRE